MTFAHLGSVLSEVEALGRIFRDGGYRLFLVGGIVRDQWLDGALDDSSDIDLTTNALPADIKRLVGSVAEDMWTQGERFGTIGMRMGGRDYEITTHRAESYDSQSRKPQVSFGDDISVDLSRRDFTVNAMAIELPDGELVDPYGGAADLEAGLLRTPLSAEISFTDDPLRMLRAARFATRLTLTIADDVVAAATSLHERLRIVAIERIGVEMRRLLGLPDAASGLRFLASTGLLSEVLRYGAVDQPALADAVSASAVDAAIASVDQVSVEWRTRLAALGLALFGDGDGVHALCRRLRLSNDETRFITGLATAAHTVTQTADGPVDDEAIRRWVVAASKRDIDHGEALAVASAVGAPDTSASFSDALERLGEREPLMPPAFLPGDEIMRVLGIAPGRQVGQAQRLLSEDYFANGPRSPEQQVELLRSWQPSAQE